MCKEILFKITGNAVDISRAHEIDLRDTFSSIDVRGANYAGKVGGEVEVRKVKWQVEGMGKGEDRWF